MYSCTIYCLESKLGQWIGIAAASSTVLVFLIVFGICILKPSVRNKFKACKSK